MDANISAGPASDFGQYLQQLLELFSGHPFELGAMHSIYRGIQRFQ
jgi:hypothetical protein